MADEKRLDEMPEPEEVQVNSGNDESDDAAADGPRGDMLTRKDLADEGDYVVMDEEAEELDGLMDENSGGDPDAEDVQIDDKKQLTEAESAAAKAKSARPVKRKKTTAPVKKDQPTPKRKSKTSKAADESRRTGPVEFVKQSVAELKKVVWPTAEETKNHFIAVTFFVIFVMTFVSILDFVFGWGLLKILG